MQFSLVLVQPLALVSIHRSHPMIVRTPARSVNFFSSTHPRADPSQQMAKLSSLAPIVAIANFHQHVDIALLVTLSAKGALHVRNVLQDRYQMLTALRVLTRRHALLAWTAAAMAPLRTLISQTDAAAVVAVATQDLIAARRLRVMQLFTVVVMVSRLIWTARMVASAPAKRGLKGQIASRCHGNRDRGLQIFYFQGVSDFGVMLLKFDNTNFSSSDGDEIIFWTGGGSCSAASDGV